MLQLRFAAALDARLVCNPAVAAVTMDVESGGTGCRSEVPKSTSGIHPPQVPAGETMTILVALVQRPHKASMQA